MLIPFHRPHRRQEDAQAWLSVLHQSQWSASGVYTQNCKRLLQELFGWPNTLLTNSCTDALEMCALLADIEPGDEVILPAYTFVSTANAFVLRGAKPVFADSLGTHPNIDLAHAASLVTPRTKALVVMHYGGQACDLDAATALAQKHALWLIEDAAQCIGSQYNNRFLGSFGHAAAFSFHDTKPVTCGEGGALVVNHTAWAEKAQIICDKGTNRQAFLDQQVSRYEWLATGSSFPLAEPLAALLAGQLAEEAAWRNHRQQLAALYRHLFAPLAQEGFFDLVLPHPQATENASGMAIVCRSESERKALGLFLKEQGAQTASHYLALHQSPYYTARYPKIQLPNAERFTSCLLRFPLYNALSEAEVAHIGQLVARFFAKA